MRHFNKAPLAAVLVPLATVALLTGCPGLLGNTTAGAEGDTSTTTTSGTTPPSTLPDLTTTGFMLECYPGTMRCDPQNPGVVQECKDTGLAWESTACTGLEQCVEKIAENTAECVGACEEIDNPTSVGCEFLAIRMNSFNYDEGDKDVVIVGNTDTTRTAQIQLYFTPNNSFTEEPLFEPVLLGPGESHIFDLVNDPLKGYTAFRTGGVFRVESDLPVTAYLHSALKNTASNDSSMLLPLPTLRQDYVIASYPGYADKDKPDEINGRPSYFDVIAVEDDTTVEWVSPRDTAAQGVLIPAVPAGEKGTMKLNRFDVLQVGASSATNMNSSTHDLSGTVVSANKKIWVVGATECAFVPFGTGYCNHLQEQMIPLEYWGKKYVGPHSPARAGEKHYWRIYAGKDGVTVTVESNDAGVKVPPITLVKRGDWKELEIPHGVSLIFTATGPILPVQYLAGGTSADKIGDPAMYQMIAVEQWLRRYVVVTGINYDLNYAQILRKKGSAPVTINGQTVGDYYLINGTGPDNQWEVADFPLADGADANTYVAESDDPFNIVVLGYNKLTPQQSAYAYPGGMNLKKIYDP
ncbi:IgGFc-binding protein [Nannocystis punicea]|uniref:IgGFc-binding protein n=1 Tax=Nannocystis punicea TaxID=2995304 RepID=A0ABY7H0R1_9BACT|nr:IgGFc-binding protein [Nannocystis poenicansa]WAS92763.1 IgGFc-binding protein [Nannocystis poenicansa]